MNKCDFCDTPCGNSWCSSNEEKEMSNITDLTKVSITDAFQMGNLRGKIESLEQILKDFPYTGLRFKFEIRDRIKALEVEHEAIKKRNKNGH